jgi:hypothetical protein
MPVKELKETIATKAPFFESFFESSFYKAIVVTLIAAFAVELRLQIENKNSKLHHYVKQITKLNELKLHHKVMFTILVTFIAAILVLLIIFTFHYLLGKVIKLDKTYITPFY